MGAVLLIASFAAFAWWLSRAGRRLDTQAARTGAQVRHPSVAGRAVSAALAAQSQADDGCVLCDEMPCEAGPHWSWMWTDEVPR